jgi:hypothetical protein
MLIGVVAATIFDGGVTGGGVVPPGRLMGAVAFDMSGKRLLVAI